MQNKQVQESRYLSEKEISQQFGISLSKLRNDRWRHQGFPYIKLGSRVLYNPEDVHAYYARFRVDPESESTIIQGEPSTSRPCQYTNLKAKGEQ